MGKILSALLRFELMPNKSKILKKNDKFGPMLLEIILLYFSIWFKDQID